MIPIINLDNIKILGTLGSGSFANVFLVNDNIKNEKLAAKIPQHESDDNQSIFMKEIHLYFKIQNPAVLKIKGINLHDFDERNRPIVFTEYMVNGSLDELFKKTPNNLPKGFTLSKFYIILLGIALGMKHLHSQGIVHRDLKPANILLDENFYPHICDLGISYISNSNIYQILMTTKDAGTPLYMAPEIIKGEDYKFKVDIYSFSLVAYQAFTYKIPYAEYQKRLFKLLELVKNGTKPDISSIKDEWIKIFLCKCWSDNPDKRPTFDEIVDELLNDKYMNYFGAKENEVNKYLSLFDKSLKIKKSIVIKDPINTRMNKKPQRIQINRIHEVKNDNLEKLTIFFKRLTSQTFLDICKSSDSYVNSIKSADIIWYDGIFSKEKYVNINPSKYLNKIPGMNLITNKRNLYKKIDLYMPKIKYQQPFFPKTYSIPSELEKFKKENSAKSLWILKNANKQNDIKIIEDTKQLDKISNPSIIQSFISPYLIDSYKFDLRFYVMITNLEPFTLYLYNEGIAYFCSEPYIHPITNNINKYAFQANNLSKSKFNCVRKASTIINKDMWTKIQKIAKFSILSISDEIIDNVKNAISINDKKFKSEEKIIPPNNRFFHLLGINIIIDKNEKPFLFKINDNPAMKGYNKLDVQVKTELMKSEIKLIQSLINNQEESIKDWTKILSSTKKYF